MPICIYCRLEKSETDFSLEHIIPQSLGGVSAPDSFKTRHVCTKCNNNLGLFADASFEKNWFVSQQLNENARLLFDPTSQSPLPLVCMGPCDLNPPSMGQDEICESWRGPLGEHIYWIRPNDEKLFWYVGGNPRTTKSVESRAYFMLSEKTHKDFPLTWLSFKEAFSGRKVSKIMCTTVVGADPIAIGFAPPDQLDEARIAYFQARPTKSPNGNISLSLYTKYDLRFLAKLAIGLSYILFGEESTKTPYSDELYKALWHKPGDELPLLYGQEALGTERDPIFSKFASVKGGVCLIVTKVGSSIAMNLNLSPKLNWTLKIAESPSSIATFNDFSLILFRSVGKSIQLPLVNFISHQLGNSKHPELEEIASKIQNSNNYYKNLTSQ